MMRPPEPLVRGSRAAVRQRLRDGRRSRATATRLPQIWGANGRLAPRLLSGPTLLTSDGCNDAVEIQIWIDQLRRLERAIRRQFGPRLAVIVKAGQNLARRPPPQARKINPVAHRGPI